MEQNTFKKTLKLASNILLIANLVLMVFALRMEHYYLAVATIASSAVSIVITALGHEKIEDAAKNLNIYFFVVSVILALSVTIPSQILYYIGLILFILMAILYLIPLFMNEKQQNNKTKK
jgi:hypothetical protein